MSLAVKRKVERRLGRFCYWRQVKTWTGPPRVVGWQVALHSSVERKAVAALNSRAVVLDEDAATVFKTEEMAQANREGWFEAIAD